MGKNYNGHNAEDKASYDRGYDNAKGGNVLSDMVETVAAVACFGLVDKDYAQGSDDGRKDR